MIYSFRLIEILLECTFIVNFFCKRKNKIVKCQGMMNQGTKRKPLLSWIKHYYLYSARPSCFLSYVFKVGTNNIILPKNLSPLHSMSCFSFQPGLCLHFPVKKYRAIKMAISCKKGNHWVINFPGMQNKESVCKHSHSQEKIKLTPEPIHCCVAY